MVLLQPVLAFLHRAAELAILLPHLVSTSLCLDGYFLRPLNPLFSRVLSLSGESVPQVVMSTLQAYVSCWMEGQWRGRAGSASIGCDVPPQYTTDLDWGSRNPSCSVSAILWYGVVVWLKAG